MPRRATVFGEVDQDDDVSIFGGTVAANAAVTWAQASATASAPTSFPPTLDVSGTADSAVNLPGEPKCKPPKWAYAEATATLINGFTITGGTGSVPVDFSVDIDGMKEVSTDDCESARAWTELIFSFEIFDLIGQSCAVRAQQT